MTSVITRIYHLLICTVKILGTIFETFNHLNHNLYHMYKLAKPFLFACLLGSVVIFTSCNDGEEGDDFVAAEIEGTWSYNSFDFEITINDVDFLEWYAEAFDAPASEFEDLLEEFGQELNEFEGMSMTFNEGGTVISSYPGEADEEGTWELNETTQTLTISFDGYPIELEVVTLTSSALVVKLGESEEYDIDQDDVVDVMAFVMTIGLTK